MKKFKMANYTINDVQWAADELSPDYRHLKTPISFDSFEFSASHLKKLCKLNDFNLETKSEFESEIIFALRGCQIGNGEKKSDGFVSKVYLTEAVPDHRQSRCVIGVWKHKSNKIAVFSGSTVPFWQSIIKQTENKNAKLCNLLSTGLYKYSVGTHRKDCEEYKITGVLRQEEKVPVLRTFNDLVFDVSDKWDFANVGDNIHPSRFANPTDAFSSEGCLTIPGGGFFMGDAEHDGIWSDFRRAAGLNPKNPQSSENGRKYFLILLTGRAARLIDNSEGSNLKRLRFGSSGENVGKLQVALKDHQNCFYKEEINGEMDILTTEAFINWQSDFENGKADGIVTSHLAEKLGFALD